MHDKHDTEDLVTTETEQQTSASAARRGEGTRFDLFCSPLIGGSRQLQGTESLLRNTALTYMYYIRRKNVLVSSYPCVS